MENSSDCIGNEPATFQLVAQCLNQLRPSIPLTNGIFRVIMLERGV
jgi:hypothetical protein